MLWFDGFYGVLVTAPQKFNVCKQFSQVRQNKNFNIRFGK